MVGDPRKERDTLDAILGNSGTSNRVLKDGPQYSWPRKGSQIVGARNPALVGGLSGACAGEIAAEILSEK